MANLGLVGYNKRFLYDAVGGLGSTNDARLSKELSVFYKILKGDLLLNIDISLGGFGYVSLVTIGDSVFPQVS